jgi:cytochrome c553
MNRVSFVKSLLVATLALSGYACAADQQPAHGAAAAAAPAKADAAKGGTLYDTGDAARSLPACVSCHGAAGNSTIAANPKLAGQIPEYVHKQLVDFTGPDRNQPVMSTYAKMLTDAEKKDVAAYLAAQKPKPGAARDKDAGPGPQDLPRRYRRQGRGRLRQLPRRHRCRPADPVSAPGRPAPGLHHRPAGGIPQRCAQEQPADVDAGQAHVGRRNEGCGRLHRRPEVSNTQVNGVARRSGVPAGIT